MSDVDNSLYKRIVKADQDSCRPVDGGYEIYNGSSNYTRPIYSPHVNDDLMNRGRRWIAYLGDTPKMVWSNGGVGEFLRYGHLFLGIRGSKWIDRMDHVTARYVYGREEYEVQDSSFDGIIRLTYCRTHKLDGMMVKVELPVGLEDRLVVACGGQGGAPGEEPCGGKSAKLEFCAEDTAQTQVLIKDALYSISKEEVVTITGTADISMSYTIGDAFMYEEGVDSLLGSGQSSHPMLVGLAEENKDKEIYLLFTVEDAGHPLIMEFREKAGMMFQEGVEYYRSVCETVKVTTPDISIDSAVTVQMMATDAAWDWPAITHGAIGWHNAQGGWRSHYGFVDAGWGDRIRTNAKQYMPVQDKNGRIAAYPDSDGRYNMNLVLVDGLMQYWEWSGDIDFFANEGGYHMVSEHLRYMDTVMGVPGTHLYENWLDAYITDNKWNNGGAGSIATAYTWRAYKTMSRIATACGKQEDAKRFQEKAHVIKKEMNEFLWDRERGVFGEYREFFGKGRLNPAPDLSTIYTIVDIGIADELQAYQLLRYSDYAIPSLECNFSGEIDFKYSSNRLPIFYSSCGLYVQELINNALAYFEIGHRDMAMKQFKACLVPLMKGKAAGQGTIGHMTSPELDNVGHIDFADASTQFVRIAVEGLFGIKMKVPDGRVDIMPGFPQEWEKASISTSYLSYEYMAVRNCPAAAEGGAGKDNKAEGNMPSTREEESQRADLGEQVWVEPQACKELPGRIDTEIFQISGRKPLCYNLKVPARSSQIKCVKVNGRSAEFTLDRFVHVLTPPMTAATVEIVYGDGVPAELAYEKTGAAGEGFTIKSNGMITEISDPQGVVAGLSRLPAEEVTVNLGKTAGHHTFFVTVKKDQMTVTLPADLEIMESVVITNGELATGSSPGMNVRLGNNTERELKLTALFSTISGSCEKRLIIPAKSQSEVIFVPVDRESHLTPGNNRITALLKGDIDAEITAEATDWKLNRRMSINRNSFHCISLEGYVNQNLKTLHENSYDLKFGGNEHYVLPNFYFSIDTKRTVRQNGRSWWEHGSNVVPDTLKLPREGGICLTDPGIPFRIASLAGNEANAVFVSLYNQYPDKINIPIHTQGHKIYFMLSVSTNNMQSGIENARITVNLADGSKEALPLVNPDNVDDWLNYSTQKPYAKTGFIQMLDTRSHSNILALDFGQVKKIGSIDFECLCSEVLAGLLGLTIVI